MRVQQWVLEVVLVSLAVVLLCLSKPTDKRSILLPHSLSPEHYTIFLTPWKDQGLFFGKAEIIGVATEETEKIVLHCKDITFIKTVLIDISVDETLGIVNIEEDLLLQRCHLILNNTLQIDHEYKLMIDYKGIIRKDAMGFYEDSYIEERKKHELMMTNVQPNYARAVFPCFDEPHYKATFQVNVAKVEGFPTIISNMPAMPATTTGPEHSNHSWAQFEVTPLMSTYQLAVVMCDYQSLTDSVTNISVWAPRSRLYEAQLALNISVTALEHCERYFKTNYTLPKLDHVALPSLNPVAIENWGAITYKKEFLLWEPNVSTWAQKEMVCHVVTHEVIHQWIGNLVTTGWWNTTWLNEGVTSFFHYFIVDQIEPTWNAMDTTFVTQIQQILTDEVLSDPKPLTNNEHLVQDAIFSQSFSASTYLKGAAIIRMVFNFMGPDAFRKAIVEYISENEFGAVDEDDFWQSLSSVTQLPIDLEEVMYSWTHQPGFPLVTVRRNDRGCITIKQEKYLGTEESDIRWTIPLTYTTSSEMDFRSTNTAWFLDDGDEVDLDLCLPPNEWIIVNLKQAGYYRVNYDPTTWSTLTYDLLHHDLESVHPVNRAQLLYDGFDLARHGVLEYPVILDLSRFLHKETEYLPWVAGVSALGLLRTQLYRTDIFPAFQRYALWLLNKQFKGTPLTGNAGGLTKELHRKLIVEFACLLGHPRCIKEATDTAYLLLSGVDVWVPVDIKPALLCAAVRHGHDEVWNYVLKQYKAAADNDRWKYLLPLACTSNKHITSSLLDEISEPKSFLKSVDDRLFLLMEIGKQDESLLGILEMLRRKFTQMQDIFDFEVILQILRTLLPPTVTNDEKEMMLELSLLINETGKHKHIELMDSIIEVMGRTVFKFLNHDSVIKWFLDELQYLEKTETSSRPFSSSKNSKPSLTTTHEVQTPQGNFSSTPSNYAVAKGNVLVKISFYFFWFTLLGYLL